MQNRQKNISNYLEAEITEGIENIAYDELVNRFQNNIIIYPQKRKGAISFQFQNNYRELFDLQTISAIYSVYYYDIPRPKAFLGHQHFHRLLEHIQAVRQLWQENTFQTLHISAAGSHTSVMQRLQTELEQHTKLEYDSEQGDLFLRIRRSQSKDGWEILVRLTPRPLTTRTWRVSNMEGALNATVAQAMTVLTEPKSTDNFLNIGCGSATLLIERLAFTSASCIIGCDNSVDALDHAQKNIATIQNKEHINLIQADAQCLPLSDASIDAICADLPFGQLVGSHQKNKTLYPNLLHEAARIAKPTTHFVALTHEIRLMNSVIQTIPEWQLKETIPIVLRGLHPRIYVLERN